VDDQKDAARVPRLSSNGGVQAYRDIIAIGGSAGALAAILDIAGAFPREFAGSILVVSHIGPNRSRLPELLASAAQLPAAHAEDGEPIRPGRIYAAPPDRHMTVEDGHIRLSRGPRQHYTRPAINPLFRSAAEFFGPRVIGVVLSGTGSDGVAGLDQIQRAGGLAVIQDPRDALYPDMPQSAAVAVQPHHLASRDELPDLLRRLSGEKVATRAPAATRQRSPDMDQLERPIALTCPECGGALRESGGTAIKEYRCHTGHRFGPKEVLDGQIEEVEHAFGVAERVLNERVELCRHMAGDARAGGRAMGVTHWDRLQKEAEEQLHVVRQFLARAPGHAIEEQGNGHATQTSREHSKA
jgi:two-component system, chemotaxis family, protein-glutamate methylesterase/glutaminase